MLGRCKSLGRAPGLRYGRETVVRIPPHFTKAERRLYHRSTTRSSKRETDVDPFRREPLDSEPLRQSLPLEAIGADESTTAAAPMKQALHPRGSMCPGIRPDPRVEVFGTVLAY